MKGYYILIIISLFSCSHKSENTINSSVRNSSATENTNIIKDENQNRIEKKYGKQWDFCDCVKKNDSIDRLLKKEKLTEIELDKILLQAEEIDKKCKVLLTDLKSNKPSDRARHQSKVKACLEANVE